MCLPDHSLWAIFPSHGSRLQARVPPEWLDRCYATTAHKLHQLSPEQLSYIAWAAGQMRVRPTFAWSVALLQASQPALAAMSPGQLVRLLWATNRIAPVPRPSWVLAAVMAARAKTGMLRPAQRQLLALALQRLKMRREQLQRWQGLRASRRSRILAARLGVRLGSLDGRGSRGRNSANTGKNSQHSNRSRGRQALDGTTAAKGAAATDRKDSSGKSSNISPGLAASGRPQAELAAAATALHAGVNGAQREELLDQPSQAVNGTSQLAVQAVVAGRSVPSEWLLQGQVLGQYLVESALTPADQALLEQLAACSDIEEGWGMHTEERDMSDGSDWDDGEAAMVSQRSAAAER